MTLVYARRRSISSVYSIDHAPENSPGFMTDDPSVELLHRLCNRKSCEIIPDNSSVGVAAIVFRETLRRSTPETHQLSLLHQICTGKPSEGLCLEPISWIKFTEYVPETLGEFMPETHQLDVLHRIGTSKPLRVSLNCPSVGCTSPIMFKEPSEGSWMMTQQLRYFTNSVPRNSRVFCPIIHQLVLICHIH